MRHRFFFVISFLIILLVSCTIPEGAVGKLDLTLGEHSNLVRRSSQITIPIITDAKNLALEVKTDEGIKTALSNVDNKYVLSIDIADSVSYGNHDITMTFTNDQQKHETKLTIKVFDILLDIDDATIYANKNVVVDLSTKTVLNGVVLQDVSFSVTTPPEAIASVNGKDLTLTGLSPCNTCQFTVIAKIDDKEVARDVARVTILGDPTLDLAFNQNSVTLQAGQTTNLTATVTSTNITTPISLTLSNLPEGLGISSPSTLTDQGIVTITTSNTMTPGAYIVSFTAASNNVSDKESITINVLPQPNFRLSVDPSQIDIIAGQNSQVTLSSEITGKFTNDITVFFSNIPTGMSVQASPFSPSVGTTNVAITTTSSLQAGNYTLDIVGIGGGLQRRTQLVINVRSQETLSLTLLPQSVTAQAGTDAYIGVLPTGNVQGVINLLTSGLPATIVPTLGDATLNAVKPLKFSIASNVPPQTYTFNIIAITEQGLRKTISASITVTQAPGFTIDVKEKSQTLYTDQNQAKYQVVINRSGGFSGVVALELTTLSGELPEGISADTVITSDATKVFIIKSTASVGVYQLKLKATNIDGSITQEVPIELKIAIRPSQP